MYLPSWPMHWLCWISWIVCVYRWLLWLRFVRLWYWLGFGVGQQASAGIVWRETTEPGACQLGHIPPSLVCLGALIQLHPPRAVESSRNCSMVNTQRFQAPQEPQDNSVESLSFPIPPISHLSNLLLVELSFGCFSLCFELWVCEVWVWVLGLCLCDWWT